MKKAFILLAAAVILFGCNNIAQYQEAINKLASDWEGATGSVTQFAETLKGEKNKFQQQLAQVTNVDGAILEQLDDAGKEQLNSIQQGMAGHGNTFNELMKNVQDFVAEWTEKGKGLEELTSGLEAGQIEGDVLAKINGLTDMVTKGKDNLNGWTGKLDSLKGEIAGSFGKFQELIGSVSGGGEGEE